VFMKQNKKLKTSRAGVLYLEILRKLLGLAYEPVGVNRTVYAVKLKKKVYTRIPIFTLLQHK